jgi:arylsulfatase A-like enzyme
MRTYHQLLTGLDDICGDIVKMLEQKGVLDDTVIIVTSDNGNMLGDHGLAAKWFMFEESIRVPLIVSAPERFGFGAGSVDRSVALNVDIAPTILALAGIPVPAGMQGRPLLEPAESRPSPGIAREFLYEHLLEIPNLPKSEGVRTSRFKYVKYLVEGGDYESLFDLTNDPFEETDLARTETGQQLLPDMRLKLSSLVAEAA